MAVVPRESATSPTTARVLLVDTDPLRRHDAARAIAQAQATPVPGGFETSGTQWAAAAVAVDRSLGDGLLTRGITRMRRAGVPVIPYGPDAAQWTLAARAKILIVCGAAPLDSRSPDFGPSLTHAIADMLAAASSRDDERRRVHEIMDRLAIVGRSEHLFAVFRWVRRIAPLSDVPALITGPTGTGKELVARAVHALDPKRARGPFVPVNCAAISEHLAESELFGHRRGAFTGADRDRPGLFQAADGGVLFLDEIGELDGRIQAKILRTLQDGRVLGVGWDRDVPVSVRVLAATNRDVTTMVGDGSFRGDLYHRLNATSVRLAPLVDRPEDIRPLAEHFVTRHGALSACGVSGVGDEFVDALRQSGLPGNVRQLENVVRRALVERDRPGPLGLGDLPPELFATLTAAGDPPDPSLTERSASTTLEAVAWETDWNLARAMNTCEALLVGAALARADGSQARAARLLGITPRSVYNKVRRYQLPARRRA